MANDKIRKGSFVAPFTMRSQDCVLGVRGGLSSTYAVFDVNGKQVTDYLYAGDAKQVMDSLNGK